MCCRTACCMGCVVQIEFEPWLLAAEATNMGGHFPGTSSFCEDALESEDI